MTTTRAGMVTLGIFATGLVALGGCASEEATETSGGMLQQSPCEEGDATACGFGKTCNEAKECVPSECHDGSEEHFIVPESCAPGYSCVFKDDASYQNGVGVCELTDAEPCDGKCSFGETCSEAKVCVPSECHDGSDEYGVGPRWCDPGQSCVFEDDASFTNGVGVCK